MPRKPRLIIPGTVYHLISRFVDRDWYIRRELEREMYMRLLARALTESDWRCLSYAVMSNHIHNLLVAGSQPLDRWIRRVHTPFADSLNRELKRIGSVFVRGPKQIEVPPADVGRVIAYVHNNPVRAGIVHDANASNWTSHRAYTGRVAVPPWLHVSEGLSRAGVTRRALDRFVVGSMLGDAGEFVRRYDALVSEPESTRVVVPPRPIAPTQVVAAVVDVLQIPRQQLCSSRRGPVERMGREVASRCAIDVGLTAMALAGALGVTQQAVSLMQRRLETADARTLRARVLERLEADSSASASSGTAQTCATCV